MRLARHGRRWGAASAYLDGELDAEARGAFERGLSEDGEARAHLEDIRFISESLAALPEAEPGRSFALTERDIAADHGVMRREPAPMALRLSAIGAAAGVAALAAVLAYDFLQTGEEGLLEPQAAPLMERAEVAGLVREEEEAAMEAEESAEEAETASLASVEEEELEVELAAAEAEEAEEESAEVDWRSREEVDAAEAEEAEPAPESEARFAAERGADEEVSEAEADAETAASAEREQEAPVPAADGAEEDAAEEPAVMTAEEEGEADAASAQLEAEGGGADDDGALLERGTEGALLPEDAAETGEAGWETPVEAALALAAAALAAATVLLGRRWRRQQQGVGGG